MIKHIVVFSRYAIRAPGFGVSLHMMIEMSLKELGIDTTFISEYEDLAGIRNSIVLFLIKPSLYIGHLPKIHDSNKNIIWNLEPFALRPCGDKKLETFRNLYSRMLSNVSKHKLHHVLFFDRRQAEMFGYKNCSYLPIGFHECIASKINSYEKKEKDAVLFVGKKERKRAKAFKLLNKIIRTSGIRLLRIDHGSFVNLENNIDTIYSFRTGINHHDRDLHFHVHWHRIMMYAANRVALLSQDDLSEFGFVDGKHYIYYNNINSLRNIDFRNYKRFENMSENMINKVRKEYKMSDLFEEVFTNIL